MGTETLGSFFKDGGAIMYVIAFASSVALAIVLDRFYYIYLHYSVNARRFMKKVQDFVAKGQFEQAVKVCDGSKNAALSQVIKAGLQRANRSNDRAMQNAVDETALELLPKLTQRTNLLQIIANIATLLGLLGTIFGIIIAFKAVAEVDPSMKQQVLTRGIAVALYTTAFGLMVAIPSLVCHALVESSTIRIIDEIDEYSVKLINLITGSK